MVQWRLIRILLLVIAFLLITMDYSSLMSTVFTAIGGSFVSSSAMRSIPRSSAKHPESKLQSSMKVPTTGAGDISRVRRPKDLVKGDSLDQDSDGEEVSEVFDLGGGTSAKLFSTDGRSRLLTTMRTSCLPKLICELNASSNRQNLGESERALLALIRDTSISTTAEVTSKYHFAAHMGQLIADVDGTGCHNFYPSCPFPGLQVLALMKKVRVR